MNLTEQLQAVKTFYRDIRGYFSTLKTRAILARRNVSVGRGVRIQHPEPKRLRLHGRLIVADYSSLLASPEDGSLGDWGFDFGDMVYIGENCNLRASGSRISIGANTMIATGSILIGANHSISLGSPMREQPIARDRLGIVIEEDVWVGAGCIILPGAHIEHGAVIAAGAVVRGIVPANTIFGGVPARQISERK